MAVGARVRVFVVEDEAVIALEIEDHLAALGYDVVGVALRADQALAMIPDAAPDLVLMDVNLGPGPNGIEVAERVRSPSGPAFVFVTAYSEDVVVASVLAGGGTCLLKPFQPEALRASLEHALSRR